MKIKEIVAEDVGMAVTSAGSVATAPAGSIFAVPMKRNMPRKRAKKESKELAQPRQVSNVLEDKE
jgi:hypothetical protein